jgi:hypothetical protein
VASRTRYTFQTVNLTRLTGRHSKKKINDEELICQRDAVMLVSLYNELCTLSSYTPFTGARGSVVVKALCYKPEGRGIASR